MKRIISALLCLLLICSLLPLTVSAVTTVSSISLTIEAPQAGQLPARTATWNGDGYSVYSVDWLDITADRFLEGDEKFQNGHQYKAQIWVESMSGYEFKYANSNTPSVTATVNGQSVTPYKAYEYSAWAMVCVDITFPTLTTTPSHTHTPDFWHYNIADHYRYCSTCDEMLDVENHKGGTATCTQKAKCTVCGFAYGEVSNDHKWSPTYLYLVKEGHAWICADCKTHSQVEPHVAGPAGTPGAEVVCKDCGYIMEPAKDHVHKLTKVPAKEATCTEPGNPEYYTCNGCSTLFADAAGSKELSSVTIGALGHKVDNSWNIDKEYHWSVCINCAVTLEETKMVHTDEDKDGKCESCGYTLGAEIPEETEPEKEDSDKKKPSRKDRDTDDEDEEMDWTWVIIAAVAVVCCAAAAVITVIIIKKKK